MKIHITNLYNFNSNDMLVAKQHKISEAVRSLGFYEMGLFAYPVESDTEKELHKRLDGVIASLEAEDIVIIQLPTENEYVYEQLLVNKIKAYKNTKIIMLIHDVGNYYTDMINKYINLFKVADVVVLPNERMVRVLEQNGINNVLRYNYSKMNKNNLYTKKVLMEAVSQVYNSEISFSDEIHIGFGIHDKTGSYCSWLGTTIQSIIEHTNAKICFHVLHDNSLTKDNQRKILQMLVNTGNRVSFHKIDETIFTTLESQMGGYTIGAMFRVLLPEVLIDIDKIIYLDADLLVNRDINELWNINIENYCLAAVPDMEVINGAIKPVTVKRGEVQAERYFNSGVIYMNLDKIRKNGNMKELVIDYLNKTKESDLPDQDALNAIYTNETLLLDGSWNYFTKVARRIGEKHLEEKIYHYVGTLCVLYYNTEYDRLFFETIGRTPWGQVETTKIIQQNLERVVDRYNQLKSILQSIATSKKKHIFYGDETNDMKTAYDLLTVKEGDYRISTLEEKMYNGILPCKHFSALLEEKDEYIIFVLPGADEGNALNNLKELGLENGKDFYVIPRFLLPHQGGYL